MSDRHRVLASLGALYVAQGLPYGFFTQALPVMLRSEGVSLEAIGMSSLLALPWMLKFAWAPLIDRWDRRRVVHAIQAATVLLLVALALVDPTRLALLTVVVLAANLLASTQDIATDGLAVRWLSRDGLGLGNVLQVAGYRAGMILSGGLLLSLAPAWGWSGLVLALAGLIALCSAVTLLLPPEPGGPTSATPWSWSWLRLEGVPGWTLVLVAFKLGDYLGQGMLRPWLVDSGWSVADIGWALGIGGFGAGVVGSLIGGLVVQALPIHRALFLAGMIQVSGITSYALASTGALTILGAVLWEHLVGGISTTVLFAAMMLTSRQEQAGTDYTLQASIVVAASVLGSTLSGLIAGQWGYSVTFLSGALLAMLAPLLVASPAAALLRR